MAGINRAAALKLAEKLLAVRGATRVQILPVAGQPDQFYVDTDLTADRYGIGDLANIAEVVNRNGLEAYFGGSIEVRSR